MRWGLIPRWMKGIPGKFATFNARVETLENKPAYRSAFRHNRAIIPVDGYYEWEKVGKAKKPWYFHKPDNEPMALAGLWDLWRDSGGNQIESFTIIVRPAQPDISDIHDRMPAILPEELWDRWLNPVTRELEELKKVLQSGYPDRICKHEANRLVNSPKNEGPDLISRSDIDDSGR